MTRAPARKAPDRLVDSDRRYLVGLLAVMTRNRPPPTVLVALSGARLPRDRRRGGQARAGTHDVRRRCRNRPWPIPPRRSWPRGARAVHGPHSSSNAGSRGAAGAHPLGVTGDRGGQKWRYRESLMIAPRAPRGHRAGPVASRLGVGVLEAHPHQAAVSLPLSPTLQVVN